MAKIANNYYSIVHSKVFRQDGKRVAHQIAACIKNVFPKSNLISYQALDIGGSNGVIAYYLAKYLKHITSIDTDKKAVSDGHNRYRRPNLKLRLFDGRKLPFSDNTFDLVIFRRTYGSVDDKEGMAQEIFRVLKPAGLVYFEGHNKLFFMEMDHKIPLLTILPDQPAKWLVKLVKGKDHYYIERYKTFWGMKKLFSNFQIFRLTGNIIKNPQKFNFTRLYKISPLTKFIPLFLLNLLEPFMWPDFIWILQKPNSIPKQIPG